MSYRRRVLVGLLALLVLATTVVLEAPPTLAQEADATVSVDPGSGPTGTEATITVTGEPNAPVVLEIGPTSTNGTTDADGNFTHTTTLSGAVGDVIKIKATVGNQLDSPSASTSFTITAPGSAFGEANSTPVASFDDPIGTHLRQHGWNEPQVDIALGNAWHLGGQTQMYGFGDDPLGEPTASEEDAAGSVPVSIGVEYVRFTDPNLLPPAVEQPTTVDDKLLIPFGNGPLETGRLYAWYWAEMAGEVRFDSPGLGYNIAWPTFVLGGTRWSSSFSGDSWTGGSHIPAFWNDPTANDPLAWFADLFVANDRGGLDPHQGAGGLAWIEGNTVGMYVPADAIMRDTAQHIAEYGFAGDFTLDAESQFDPNAPRKVTVFPANFSATGRDGGLEPVTNERFPINVGFQATYGDVRDAIVYRDLAGELWVALYFLEGWPLVDAITHFLETYFSFFVGVELRYQGMNGPFVGTQVHDGVPENLGFGPDAEFDPTGIRVMEDGSVRLKLEYPFDMLAGETDMFEIGTFGAVWVDETTTERQSIERTFEYDIDDILDEANPPASGDSFFDVFFELRPVHDVVTGEQLIDPVDLVDEPDPEPESAPTTTLPPATTDEPETTVTETSTATTDDVDRTCWWCWGLVGFLLLFLLAILYVWLKHHDWWTCWLPWFLVIFLWAPFLLAGMWWWRPAWWWVPLLAWFPIIGGYAWYWARHRSWWQPWYLYVVGGYLAVLAVGMVVVGSPEWGLLLPLFWVPWVGFYLWYRGQHQPWWRSWMWLAGAGFVIWNFVWVIALSPWWAWWLPVVLGGGIGWWFVQHRMRWSVLHGPKWCWIAPFGLLPFLAWWIPLWGPWWCFVILAVFAATFFCAIFNHFKLEEWWTCWLPWFFVIWVLVPFLLMGLWFFQPNWWWLPLLAWFPVIAGYAYFWGRRRSWWLPWHWYVVGGYLAALGVGMLLVGSPTWGLLLPLSWLGPAAFYLWYRPRRQAWFAPWMWGAFGAWILFVFVWAINLSPYWGAWWPLVVLPFFGWWGVTHGYSTSMWARKATAVLPLALVPWLGYMLAIYCIPAYYL